MNTHSVLHPPKSGQHHKPLRTFKEFVAEFGVSAGVLRYALGRHDGPKPKLTHSGTQAKNCWYDPDAMRMWWKNTVDKLPSKGGVDSVDSC